MTEAVEKGEGYWGRLGVKVVIATLVFPIVALVIYQLLFVPAAFLQLFLVHFGGSPKFWARTLSIIALLLSCSGAGMLCKRIWPKSQ